MSWTSNFTANKGLGGVGAGNNGRQNPHASIEKYLYVQAKLLNFIELAYNEGKVSKTQFNSLLAEKMQLINDYKQRIPNFDAQNFIERYELQNQIWINPRLKNKQSNKEMIQRAKMQLYEKARKFFSELEVNENNPVIQVLKGPLYDLVSKFDETKQQGYLDSSFCVPESRDLHSTLQNLDQKNTNDLIRTEDFDKLVFSTETILKRLSKELGLDFN